VRRALILVMAVALAACAPRAANPPTTPTIRSTGGDASATTAPTPDRAVLAGKFLILVNGTLIDGTGREPLVDAAVAIQDGLIVYAGPGDPLVPAVDAEVVDVGGAAILPGFINAHVHEGYTEEHLRAWAQAGVTTVRDLAASPAADLFARRDALLQDNGNARLIAVGPMVTVPGGYPIVPWGMGALTVDSPEDAERQARELLDQGADLIKIPLETGAAFGREIPVLSPAEATAIVRVAHGYGTRVSAHVLQSEDLPRVLEAGVDDLAHMVSDPLSDQLIEKVVQAKMYWVPTIELWMNVGQGGAQAITNLRRFVAAGGQVALGTDYAGYATEFDLGMPIREIEWMLEAGMTPMQVIVAGTKNAAYVCNREHELGTLELGKLADVLVVNGDPLQDIHALLDVQLVIHNGEIIGKE
jgi:imidazolonepropionase-like amidohydrolase